MRQEFEAVFTPRMIEAVATERGGLPAQAGADLREFVRLAAEAGSQPDLDRAAGCLARAVAVAGGEAVAAVLLAATGKREAAPPEAVAEQPFWEASDFGPDFPGTAVPQGFLLKVGGRTFHVKPHAVKHMVEKSAAALRQRPLEALAAQRHQVDFPISSLAGALEQAEARGFLTSLLQSGRGRLGSRDVPLRVGDWELAVELIDGRLEVFHANYQPKR
jgi:hypothetical protein